MELERQAAIPPPLKKDYSDELRQIIQNVSSSQRFQYKIMIFMLLVGFLSNIQLNSSHVMYMNPAFECQGEPEKVKEVKACKMLDSCSIINKQMLTAQLGLYCGGRQDDRVFIQSAVGMGNWAGIIFSTLISDRLGRKFCFCFALFVLSIGCILQFIGATKNITSLMAIAQVIYGFSGKSVYVAFLLLSTRFLKKKDYEFATIAWFIFGTGISNIIIAALNEYFASWRLLFYIYCIGFFVTSLFSILLLKQDPIYYFDCERYDECKEVIRAVGQENGTNNEILEENLKKIDVFIEAKAHGQLYHEKKLSQFNLTELLRCDILTGVVVLGLIGLFYSMASVSIDYSMQNLKLSYNFNLFIVGCSNIVGYFTSVYIILAQKQRQKGLLLSSAICGVAGMLFIFDYCSNNPIIQCILIAVMKITLCWIGGFYVRLKVDLFPERYQGTLVGIIEFIAGFGKTLGPVFVQFSSNHSINPIFSVNILRLTFGTLPVYLMSEKKINLAELQHKEPKEQSKMPAEKKEERQ